LSTSGFDDATASRWIDALVDHVTGDGPPPSPWTPRDAASLAYALKLTRTPGAMSAEDLAPMRAAGMTDAEILDVNQVVAYFAYVNRVADGLGVPLETTR
jgi:uncharacterized peroxidase-related enzyme